MPEYLTYSPEPDHTVRPPFNLDTLPGLIAQTVRRQPDGIALQWREDDQLKRITYGQLWSRVEALVRALLANGLGPEDHLGIWSENRWEWVVAYLAILRTGATVVPLDALQKPHEIRHILVDAGVRLIFTSHKFADSLLEIAERIPGEVRLVSFDEKEDSLGFAPWLKQGMSGDIPDKIRPDLSASAAIIYTSGTTGFAKGVLLTHRNIASNIAGFYQVLDFQTGDVFLSVLPLHHTFECTVGMLGPLIAGCTIHYARSLKSRDIIDDLAVGGITIMLGVPLLFDKLLDAINRGIDNQSWHRRALLKTMRQAVRVVKRATGANLGTAAFRALRIKAGMGKIRLMISGGAALPASIAESYNELGFPLMQGYGLTETSPVLATNTPGHTKHTSVGKVIPGVSVRIDNPDTGGIGEIMAKGDCVMVGYYKNEAATKSTFRDGWFATGDTGWLDKEGYLTIAGRVKEIIVTGAGKNINPEEVEAELNKSSYILESLVIGIPSRSGVGEGLGALVVPNYEAIDQSAEARGVTMTPKELDQLIHDEVRDRCRDLPKYKHVKKVRLHMEEFQRTSTGKIKRFLYRGQFASISAE